MTKWIAALVLAACTQANAAQYFSPEINADTGTPTIALKVNNQTGEVFIHSKGKWVSAQKANNPQDMKAAMENSVQVSADSSIFDYFWNFYYGSYNNYWSYYPQNYYYYTPNSYLYYNNYSYYPYYYNNNSYWSYYSYRW